VGELRETVQKYSPPEGGFFHPDSSCKDVFAAYLTEVALRVKQDSLKQFAEFLDALITCLNLKGWSLPGEAKDSVEAFCSVRTARHVPDIANYFITDFLEEHRCGPSRDLAVEMMMHLCKWLYAQRFTNLKLSLIDPTNA
jgi:hypothetical protein